MSLAGVAHSAAGIDYGRRATIGIVACIAVALASMPPGVGNVDRWVDVIVSVAVVGAVVRGLAARNERLVAGLKAEARVDALTGLLNRRGFEERFAVEVARATRAGPGRRTPSRSACGRPWPRPHSA